MITYFEARVKWIAEMRDAARVEFVLTERGDAVDVLGGAALSQAKDANQLPKPIRKAIRAMSRGLSEHGAIWQYK